MARLVFLSCHLSGTGHLVRTLRLAKAAIVRGHETVVISGGRPLPHVDPGPVEIVQIPALQVAKLDFSMLRRADNALADDAYMALRQRAIEAALSKPIDALITELFPLGRRALAQEFLFAIAAARRINPNLRVIASVRDIPEPKPKRLAEAAGHLSKHYHAVLVHGDASLIALWETWPLPEALRPMVHHTGYVAPRMLPGNVVRGKNVLVSAGGGTLGDQLLVPAVDAAAVSDRPWHILVGGADAADRVKALRTRHTRPGLTIETARQDYLHLLGRAACSISLAGYNTAVELAGLATPALLVPSEEEGEQEQLLRARALAGHPGVEMLRANAITPKLLCERAEALATAPARAPIPLRADDGTGAISVIERLLPAS